MFCQNVVFGGAHFNLLLVMFAQSTKRTLNINCTRTLSINCTQNIIPAISYTVIQLLSVAHSLLIKLIDSHHSQLIVCLQN